MAKVPQKRSIDKKPAFLAAFVITASLTEAAKAVGIDRGVHYDWLRDDPEYAKAFADAKLQAGDTLKDDAVEWARKGVFEPLVYQGRFQFAQREKTLVTLEDGREVDANELEEAQTEYIRVHGQRSKITGSRNVTEDYGPPLGIYRRSEGLMQRLLKAFLPDEFAERGAVEVTGKDGGPVENSLTVTFVRPGGKE